MSVAERTGQDADGACSGSGGGGASGGALVQDFMQARKSINFAF